MCPFVRLIFNYTMDSDNGNNNSAKFRTPRNTRLREDVSFVFKLKQIVEKKLMLMLKFNI